MCNLQNHGICMIQYLKDRMSSISSDLYEETLKPNKSHTNHIIQIVSCTTAFQSIKISTGEFIKEKKICKDFCSSNWIHEIT